MNIKELEKKQQYLESIFKKLIEEKILTKQDVNIYNLKIIIVCLEKGFDDSSG